ncbi:MAG: glycosyltransferase family 4 protein [Bryobacteraceae bacterium]|jgi:glycosyltransferase involved in cell wall biosynthesis
MRVLLTANASYLPPRGGATRSNLAWLEHLAAVGHDCHVVCAALASRGEVHQQVRDEEIDDLWLRVPAAPGIQAFERGGVSVHSVTERARLVSLLRDQIREFQPDWVLVSSEDLGHVLLREAARSAPGRIVYLAHTPQFFPFGPASWNPDAEATDLVRQAAGVVTIGYHTGGYVAEHTGAAPEVIHPPIYGSGPFPDLASFHRGRVTMINPCAVKGISIFLALADRFRDVPFGALPGWGTTSSDRRELERRPNVVLLPNYKDIDSFFRQTRVLLMPSLWYEGFGLSVLEAKLRGIPTISSNSGGLVEANLGAGCTVGVHGIERFEAAFDERGMPKPVLPENDIGPWAAVLGRLLADRGFYEATSGLSRSAALAFVARIRPGRMEEYLLSLRPVEGGLEPPRAEALSAEKRELLLRRLRQNAARRNLE